MYKMWFIDTFIGPLSAVECLILAFIFAIIIDRLLGPVDKED